MLLIARICLKCLESWSSQDCHINSFVLSLKLFLFAFICYDKQSNFGSFIDQTFTPNGKLHFILTKILVELDFISTKILVELALGHTIFNYVCVMAIAACVKMWYNRRSYGRV